MKEWPNKQEREAYEIKVFCKVYSQVKGRDFTIAAKREKPDYIIKDSESGGLLGVELTSHYLDDRSVPDVHRVAHDKVVDIPYNEDEILRYEKRLVEAVSCKNRKALNYSTDYPLILSVYANEYCMIYFDDDRWSSFYESNKEVLDRVTNFEEIVFWLSEDNFFVYPETGRPG